MRLVLNDCFLFTGTLLFDEKTRQCAALFWFGLRIVEILQVLLTGRPPNKKWIRPAFFGDRFGGKYCGLCTKNLPAEEVGCLDGFLYEAAQNSRSIKKSKTYSG